MTPGLKAAAGAPEPPEQEFPDCAECAPCRCDDECDCNGGVCSMCGHWTDMTTKKVYIVLDRRDYDTEQKAQAERTKRLADAITDIEMIVNDKPPVSKSKIIAALKIVILPPLRAALSNTQTEPEESSK